MSIYITKDGQKKKINVSATDVQLLDIDGRFKSKNLEDALKEVGSGTEENMTRIENKVEQLSNPNLLINGDFRVNTKGKESFTEQNTETINKWLSTFADTESITVDRHYNNDSNSYYMRVTFTGIGANKAGSNLHQILEDTANGYSIVAGKTITFSADCYATTSARCIFIGYTTNRGTSFEYAIEPIIKDVDKKRYKITATIPVNATQVHCGLGMCRLIDDTMVGQYADIYNAKLEIGEYATPFTPKPYHEELLACNDGVIGSNPNLLINGDFRINQRGEQTYTNSGGHKYTVDRWNCWSANGKTGTIQKQDDGILCTLDDSCRIRQAIELPPQMQNQYVTLSFEGSVTQGECWVSIMASDSISDYSQSISFGSVNCNDNKKLTVKVIQLKKYLVVDFFTKVRGIIKLKWVKLEFGTVATPFVPKLYSQELADCSRYYEKVVGSHGFATCYGNGTNTVRCITRYSPKRISPTVTISALSTFLVEIGNSDIVPTGYASQYFDPYGNGYFIFNVSNVTNGLAGRVKRSDKGTAYIEFDAEIY